ncbi:hypothetical protein BGM26_09025 [Bacillus sp. FJAT-29790]|uniref:hypothetical protein n=1 Tax=Bacillus sp. FJAT-29790 TaxID=1895002 RepID=UPI001C23DC35|nr:hypothetical protein [Bacillus sp. FJAT-29790]MBU8879126.1 hypothetical protein [Bacillus sp. FJAT-29790]
MLRKILQLITGFLCGYLFIIWFPISFPAELSNMIVAVVLKPFEFFAAMLVFVVGFLTNAEIIREGIILTVNFFCFRKLSKLKLLMNCLILISFFVLFKLGFWETVVFFCFSFIYGIISLDFKKLKIAEDR